MLKSIAEEITVVLAANDVIKTDEMEAYNYGLQLLVPKVILYITILIVSLITNTIWVSFAFVVLFMTLRRYAGGFHCKTAETCLFFSFLIYLLVLFGYDFIQRIPQIGYGLSSLFSAIVVLTFAPIEDVNRPLEGNEKVQYRLKSMAALVIILVAELVSLVFQFKTLSYVSACSLTANAVLILLSQLRRCKNEVENSKSGCENN
ncbi:MAG: accessory gene regulator B family protein [Clostridia bacterium]|nr:accessory gene regulator B family protein [Clostridia bacterium]